MLTTPIFQLYFATSFKCALFLNVFVKNIVLRKKYCAIFYYCDINFASNQSLSYQLLTFDIFCYCKQFPICAFLWGHPRAINQLHPNHVSFMQHIYSTNTYSKNVHSPTPVPEGHTETHQLKFIPQVLACYIQYQAIYSTDLYFPNCWYHIKILVYNFNLYIFPKQLQHYTIHIYILSSSFSYQVHFKNITYVGSMWFEAVFVSFCICVSVYLQH